jgi:phage baseplate assembly protein W
MLTFRGESASDTPIVYDVEAVKVSVRNILMWRVGESVISPEFGHNLKLSMYAQLTNFNQDAIGEEIKRAIEDNEPRANVDAVVVNKDDDDSNALHVKVVYTVVGDKTKDAKITEQTTILGK